MASNYTTNYQLNQWEAGDQVLRTEFNQDNQKIDTALAGLDGRTEALETMATSFGNCRLYYGTYTGTGSGATQLTFSHTPLFVAITGTTERTSLMMIQGSTSAFAYQGSYSMAVDLTWNGTTLNIVQDDGNLGYQCNLRGQVYHVIALMETRK